MQVYYSRKKQGKRVWDAEEVPRQGDEAGTSNGWTDKEGGKDSAAIRVFGSYTIVVFICKGC